MSSKIVVVGSFNVDLTAYMNRMPKLGETVSGHRFKIGPGGKGSNQAIAAARLGAEVHFIGRVGSDIFSPIAFDIWEKEGINTKFVKKDANLETGVAPIFVDDNGENSICVVLGANLSISTEDIDAAKQVISEADILMTQLEINEDATVYALKLAKDLGIKTILNPAPAKELPPSIFDLVDYLTPNETELEVLTNHVSNTIPNAVKYLTSDKDLTLVVTLGSQGAMSMHHQNSLLVPGFSVPVVDTTGAGDAFNAGLAVALAEGKNLSEAILFANASAALCVTRLGTAPSMPKRTEVDKFLVNNQPNYL